MQGYGGDINRLEQRLLREQNYKYFNPSSDLKVHNKIMADEITKPVDVGFEENPSFRTKLVNAVVSQRMNKYKTEHYKMKIQVGKVVFDEHPQMTDEDRRVVELKKLYNEYENRTLLQLIPFYQKRIKILDKDLSIQYHERNPNPGEIKFLQENLKNVEEMLDKEKTVIQNMAKSLYDKWHEIKSIRTAQGFIGSSVKLLIRTYQSSEGTEEYEFGLTHELPSEDKSSLTSTEVNRRAVIRSTRIFLRLMINGEYVARTNKKYVTFPNFEVDICEQFVVYLYTMPNSIAIDVVTGTMRSRTLATMYMEVPGMNVRTITSTSTLIRQLQFPARGGSGGGGKGNPQGDSSQGNPSPNPDPQPDAPGTLPPPTTAGTAKPLLEYTGSLFVKAEWVGFGDRLPPLKIVANKEGPDPNFHPEEELTEELKYEILHKDQYFDVNDPRNELKLKIMKEYKNSFLRGLLKRDAMIPLYGIVPSRHKLIKARYTNVEIMDESIPLLEEEILQNAKLKDFLDV